MPAGRRRVDSLLAGYGALSSRLAHCGKPAFLIPSISVLVLIASLAAFALLLTSADYRARIAELPQTPTNASPWVVEQRQALFVEPVAAG